MMSMSMNSEYLCVLEEQLDVTRLGIGTLLAFQIIVNFDWRLQLRSA